MTSTIEGEIIAQDKSDFRWATFFTLQGDFFGMYPPCNHIEYRGSDIICFNNDRIVELWSQMYQVDFTHQLKQT
jgi:predicted ester cyclase